MKRKQFAYFRDGNGFLGVTNESPMGMQGTVFAGRGPQPGQGIESVREQAYAKNQLDKMDRVEADDVPDDWFAAIGYEKRIPKPEPQPEENVTYLTMELPGDRLRRKILAKPGTRDHDRWKEERREYAIAAIITAIVMYCLYAWRVI